MLVLLVWGASHRARGISIGRKRARAASFASFWACTPPAVQSTLTIQTIARVYRSIDELIRGQRQEFDERIRIDELREEPRCIVVSTFFECRAEQFADFRELLGNHLRHELLRDLAPVVERTLRRADPLPH